MNYKLIGFDMDGTLLNSKQQISKRTLEMINKAHEAGKVITLSTGRCLPEIRDYFSVIPHLKYIICVSGAMIYDVEEERTVCSTPISPETVTSIMEKGKRDDIMVHLLSTQSIVEKDKVCNLAHYNMGQHQEMFNRITTKVDNIFEHFENNKRPIEKVNFFSTSAETRKEVRNMFIDSDLAVTDGEGYTLEFTKKGISKASALKELCRMLNIDIKETIIVGDGENDIEILKAAGLGVAMANASDTVKEASDVIVSDNNHDGCAEAIKKYLLGDTND